MSSNFVKLGKGYTLESLAADPIDGQNGDIYYNSTLSKFRKYQSGSWEDMDTTGSPTALTRLEYLTSGTWNVPIGIEQAFILACGGGGGGSAGASGVGDTGDITGGGGGSGGHGSVPFFVVQKVTGGSTLTITLGAGGTGGLGGGSNSVGGAGAAGGATTITGGGVNLFFPGAPGGNPSSSRVAGGISGSATTNATISPYTISSVPGGNGSNGILNGAAANGSPGQLNIYNQNLSQVGGGSSGIADSQGGGGGGGGGGNSIGIGGSGGHGAKATNYNFGIQVVTRTSNVVTIQINEAAYAARPANIGEFINVASLDAALNGVTTIIGRPANNQLQYRSEGPDLYVFAQFSGQVAGMLTNVLIRANTAGTVGNAVNLTFNGVQTINQRITTWNAANPANQITLISGDGTQIPNNLTNMQLAGGTDQVGSFTFSRLNNRARFNNLVAGMTSYVHIEADLVGVTGNAITLNFDGLTTINATITAWNAANPSNRAFLIAGDGTQIPDSGTVITLTGGAAAATANSGGNGQPGNGPGAGGGAGGGGGCGSGSGFTSGGHGGVGRAGAVILMY